MLECLADLDSFILEGLGDFDAISNAILEVPADLDAILLAILKAGLGGL